MQRGGIGIDSAVAALGEVCGIARPLDAKPPVFERGLAVGLDLLGGRQCRCDLGWFERRDEGVRHSLVDLHATDVEAIAAAPLDEPLTCAMIPRCRIATTVMRAQTAATMTAAGEAL